MGATKIPSLEGTFLGSPGHLLYYNIFRKRAPLRSYRREVEGYQRKCSPSYLLLKLCYLASGHSKGRQIWHEIRPQTEARNSSSSHSAYGTFHSVKNSKINSCIFQDFLVLLHHAISSLKLQLQRKF